MREFEIKISASYITSGGSKEWNAFKKYVVAKDTNEAKRKLKAELKADGYRDITISDIID
jgi:hypothetical protein